MTTMEIADFFNVSARTIQKKANALGIKLLKGHVKNWTKEECDLLAKELADIMIIRWDNFKKFMESK